MTVLHSARVSFAIVASGLSLAVGSVAHADDAPKQQPVVPLSEVFDAYQAICYAHPGDPDAQAKAAATEPWNFKFEKPAGNGAQTAENGRLSFHTQTVKNAKACMILGIVDRNTSQGAGVALARPLLGDPYPAGKDSFVTWFTKVDGKDANHLFVVAPTGNKPDDHAIAVYSLATQ